MGLLGLGIDFTQFMFPEIIGITVIMSSFMAGVSLVGKMGGAATVALAQGILMLLFAPLICVSLSARNKAHSVAAYVPARCFP